MPYAVQADETVIKDVPTSDVRYDAIKWATETRYMDLINGEFKPNKAVFEKELLEVIARADANYIGFSKTTDMYYNIYGSKFLPLNGTVNKSYRDSVVTRGHFARIYAATQGKDLSEPYAVQYLYINEIAGVNEVSKTYYSFKPSEQLTRGDLAVFLYNIVKKAKNDFRVEGLYSTANGSDDSSITLPTGFMGEGTIGIDKPETGGGNDASNHPKTFDAVQSIFVEKDTLIANGVDTTLVKIKLKDGYGNPISTDQSLQFKVTSQNGALFSATGNSFSQSLTSVMSDGGELSFYVTAPEKTTSVIDLIQLQLINNNEKRFEVFKTNTIDVRLRYVPQAELRITYEVYDQNDGQLGGNIDPGIKPLPALPLGFTPNDGKLIKMTEIDVDRKLFTGVKEELVTQANGTIINEEVTARDIQYENANLQYAKYPISVWLFEKLYEESLEQREYPYVYYTLDSEGRATYNYPNLLEKNYLDQFEAESHAVLIYLIGLIPEDKKEIKSIHYDSVKAIKAIYDSLSIIDQNKLRDQFKNEIAKLDAANAQVDSLKKSEEQTNKNMKRYTKVIVSLIAPGGKPITNYKGTVKIEYNGQARTVGFTTNTFNEKNNTGHAGAAVVYFDDVIYGYSDVKATLVTMDDNYKSVFNSLLNKTVTEKIFTNSKFEKNMCSRPVEVAYVVDQSASMRKIDRTNFIATKTKELIAQMNAGVTIAVRAGQEASVQAKGNAKDVANVEGLFNYDVDNSNSTNLSKGLEVALSNLSDNDESSKVIILISDGKTSQAGIQHVLTQAKDKNVQINTVTVGKATDVNITMMKRIASETGGTHYHVTDVYALHSTYQSLIDSILCEMAIEDTSCENPNALINEAEVIIGRSFVSLNGEILPNCSNVAKMEVRFESDGGSMAIALVDRGSNIHRTSIPVRQFSNFNLFNEVEFRALDKNGKVIGYKKFKVQ